MTDKLVIALAQLNPTVGKIGANLEKLRETRKKAAEEGADLILTSELYTCGYPPEDLVRRQRQMCIRDRTSFVSRNLFHRYGAPLRRLPPKQVMVDQRCF